MTTNTNSAQERTASIDLDEHIDRLTDVVTGCGAHAQASFAFICAALARRAQHISSAAESAGLAPAAPHVPRGVAKLLRNLREEGILSEGQITKALGVDRLTCREILDEVEVAPVAAASTVSPVLAQSAATTASASGELIVAADAVVERWHSRDWKQPHTAEFINRLAAAVGAAKRNQGVSLAQQGAGQEKNNG